MTIPGGDRSMRASDEDRHRVEAVLSEAFVEGRLDRATWEERATALARAATYADLDRLVADLPTAKFFPPAQSSSQFVPYVSGYPYPYPDPYAVVPAPPTNGMAVASLVCGLGQLAVGPPAGVAAIVLGHLARRRTEVTGEQGSGMATTGLVLGYIGVIGTLLLFLIAAIAIASTS